MRLVSATSSCLSTATGFDAGRLAAHSICCVGAWRARLCQPTSPVTLASIMRTASTN
jgi:hypothetical protein